MRVIALLLLLSACSDVGSASIGPDGHLTASNDKPFPVLSASKIIPAAMALERRDPALMPLIRRSIIDSDNAATDQLTRHLGGKSAVQRWMRSKGLRPYFTATEAEMVADPNAMLVRPSELALTLYRIRSPELVALMAQTRTGNDRIRAVYPNAPHKSGTLPPYYSDVGLVDGTVIAVMGDAPPSDLAEAVRSAGMQRSAR